MVNELIIGYDSGNPDGDYETVLFFKKLENGTLELVFFDQKQNNKEICTNEKT